MPESTRFRFSVGYRTIWQSFTAHTTSLSLRGISQQPFCSTHLELGLCGSPAAGRAPPDQFPIQKRIPPIWQMDKVLCRSALL